MDIPKHWKKVPLRELVIIQKGTKPRNLRSKRFDNSVHYLDIEAIEKGHIKQYADLYSSVIATEGDIFVLRTGGRNGLILKGKNGAVGSTLFCLTPILIEKKYLYYYLKLS